ncbi:MAG: NAD-dependent protein deacetylase [Massilia sp.]|nr:NAD-dependent protein deacetylase [Massilia sp.]
MQHMHVSLEVDQIDELASFLTHHRHVLVPTGAGISTASGIPDYRGHDGVRRGRAPCILIYNFSTTQILTLVVMETAS